MDKHRRRNIKLNKHTPDVDLTETAALIELLFVATKENNTQCARLMDISTSTWRKWSTETPTSWYWPTVIRIAIKHTLASLIAQRRMTSKKFQRQILERLSQIPHSKDFEEEISNRAYEVRGAERHIRDLLAKGGMWWSAIQLPANSQGYSRSMLRSAARTAGVIMEQRGFGEEKDSWWELP